MGMPGTQNETKIAERARTPLILELQQHFQIRNATPTAPATHIIAIVCRLGEGAVAMSQLGKQFRKP